MKLVSDYLASIRAIWPAFREPPTGDWNNNPNAPPQVRPTGMGVRSTIRCRRSRCKIVIHRMTRRELKERQRGNPPDHNGCQGPITIIRLIAHIEKSSRPSAAASGQSLGEKMGKTVLGFPNHYHRHAIPTGNSRKKQKQGEEPPPSSPHSSAMWQKRNRCAPREDNKMAWVPS